GRQASLPVRHRARCSKPQQPTARAAPDDSGKASRPPFHWRKAKVPAAKTEIAFAVLTPPSSVVLPPLRWPLDHRAVNGQEKDQAPVTSLSASAIASSSESSWPASLAATNASSPSPARAAASVLQSAPPAAEPELSRVPRRPSAAP